MINFNHLQVLSRRCLRREKERSFEKFFLTKDSEVVLHSPEASLLIAPARDSCFVKELAVACQPANIPRPRRAVSWATWNPEKRQPKTASPDATTTRPARVEARQLSSVWCAKTGTALNDERDSGSFESPHPPAGYPSIHALVNSLRMFNVRKVVTHEYS